MSSAALTLSDFLAAGEVFVRMAAGVALVFVAVIVIAALVMPWEDKH